MDPQPRHPGHRADRPTSAAARSPPMWLLRPVIAAAVIIPFF